MKVILLLIISLMVLPLVVLSQLLLFVAEGFIGLAGLMNYPGNKLLGYLRSEIDELIKKI